MIRKIIRIDEEKCNGCAACAKACHEGAIEMINGKAKLTKENYCDGLGDCLPACPTNAISFEEREAAAYDEDAVNLAKLKNTEKNTPCGCPGSQSRTIVNNFHNAESAQIFNVRSRLSQWPVQIKLVPTKADFFENANLLIAADCTAFAYGNFHNDFIQNHIVLIGCPKLDEADYSEKLTAILRSNNIKSLKIVRMEVPCCGGIEKATKQALSASGKSIPLTVTTISINGKILN